MQKKEEMVGGLGKEEKGWDYFILGSWQILLKLSKNTDISIIDGTISEKSRIHNCRYNTYAKIPIIII